MPLAFSPWQALRRAWPLHNLRERLNGVFAQSLQELALGRFAHAPAPIVFPRAENPSARLLCALGVGLPDVYPRCLGTLQAIWRLGSSLGLRKLAAVHTPRLWRWRNDPKWGAWGAGRRSQGVAGQGLRGLGDWTVGAVARTRRAKARLCGAWGVGRTSRPPPTGRDPSWGAAPRPGGRGPIHSQRGRSDRPAWNLSWGAAPDHGLVGNR